MKNPGWSSPSFRVGEGRLVVLSWVLGLLVFPLGGVAAPEAQSLLGASPLVGRATAEGATLTVIGGSAPTDLLLELREDGDAQRFLPVGLEALRPIPDLGGRAWHGTRAERAARSPEGGGLAWTRIEADEYTEIVIGGLEEGRSYRWRLRVREAEAGERSGAAVEDERFVGRFVTVRPRGSEFRFALMADMHFFVGDLGPRLPAPDDVQSEYHVASALQGVEWFRRTRESVVADYRRVAAAVRADEPDFVVGLGDHFDLHGLDFNSPFFTRGQAEAAHGEARELFAETLASCGALYQVLGNWEGESGNHPPSYRALAIQARRRFQVNPRPDTPGVRAGPLEDYYAWRWGDLLLVALNVRGYTPSVHDLGGPPLGEGGPEDFTLGKEQKRFVEEVLSSSDLPYKVVLIHHPVGGSAPDIGNASYGRGGGNAAHVGEQAWLHQWMQDTGVSVMFYGHDHVFTDLVVDGIHYSLPGTTSAPWRFGPEVTGYEKSWPDSGYGRVTVSPESMKVEFVSVDQGVLLDYDVAPRR